MNSQGRTGRSRLSEVTSPTTAEGARFSGRENSAGTRSAGAEGSIPSRSTMNAKTLKALRGSIDKWEAIVAGTGKDEGATNCPLCALFHQKDCRKCPVSKRTGYAWCDNTPYRAYLKARISGDGRTEALAELAFLKSLLPAE